MFSHDVHNVQQFKKETSLKFCVIICLLTIKLIKSQLYIKFKKA